MKGKGVFITGTDTGVGKTAVAATIIRALRKRGMKVGAMKPIETGCFLRDGILFPADGAVLREAAGMHEPLEIVAPLRCELPLAPLVASEIEGRRLDLNAVRDAYASLSRSYEFMVVEGAGGLLVPVLRQENGSKGRGSADTSFYFIIDLIKEMDLPVVVVAGPALGTLNHTLLTVEHALREGLRVAGVVINHARPPANTHAEKTNPDVLREICPFPFVEVMPYADMSMGIAHNGALDSVIDSLMRGESLMYGIR